MAKFFKTYFLTGLVVLVPIGFTALIVRTLFHFMDAWASPWTARYLGHTIPGVGLIFTILLIVLTGLLSSNVVGRWVLGAVDRLLMGLPVFSNVFAITKQVLQVFSPAKGSPGFQSVVLVKHPHNNTWSLGFRTRELRARVHQETFPLVAVYLPTNHLYLGDTFLFPADHVHATGLTVQEGIQCVITAGAALPPEILLS